MTTASAIKDQTLLDITLSHATKDHQTTSSDGKLIQGLPEGSQLRASTPIVDDRGSLFEIFSTQWELDEGSFEHLYGITLRPGLVKGWGLHKEHDDRYFILSGDMQVVLYDVRPESSTYGEIFKITLSGRHRRMLTIPAYVWHADYNPGNVDTLFLNMPTKHFDHENPDKYRLPVDTDLIPHDFGKVKGG